MQAIDPVHTALQRFAAAGLPRLLFVTHAWDGGVDEHVSLLSNLLAGRARVMVLRPAGEQCVELALSGLRFRVPSHPWPLLLAALRALDFARAHVHQTHGLPAAILDIDVALQVPLDCTLHDYVSICPQNHLVDRDGQYCGEPDDNACNRCIADRPHAWQKDIAQWRGDFAQMLGRAERVWAPSDSVGTRLRRYFPQLVIATLAPPEVAMAQPQVVKVALLGSLSRAKGLAIASEVARHAKAVHSPILLRLIGHAAEPLPASLPFQATGSYAAAELPMLIASERPDVIWLPSQVPETFSFTLTAAIESGISIVAANIGALAERLLDNTNAILLSPTATASEWHDALLTAAARASPRQGASDTDPELMRRTRRRAHALNYVEEYLRGVATHSPAATADPLLELQARLATTPDIAPTSEPAILSAFKLGFYGGHRASVQHVEHALASLPSGERQIVGRTEHEATASERDSAVQTLQAMRDEYAASAEHKCRQQAALDDAEARAVAARAHIAHLESTVQQQRDSEAALQAAHEVLRTSWSLRITLPLRKVASALRRARHIVDATLKLLPRIPALSGRAMERYRRGGWRGLRERMLLEFQPVAVSAAVILPDATLAPISALALATTALNPVVSLVIPVYGQHATTFACLKSIHSHPTRRTFEVIVMDDCSPEPVAQALALVTGLRVIRNSHNLGFIGNVNAAAAHALGHWLIILNNDTVVREGALDALLDTFDTHQNVGLSGAKLLNMNGSVQEAGGIVWRDGSACNWGRGQDRQDPRFNYVRDADYCSGAALAIKRDLFMQLGGFDTHYAPAYYEDTDLAFRVRANGLRVLYQPAAEIFHREGASHGRDESTGIKSFQVANAAKFYARWKETLLAHRENGVQPELEAHRTSRSNILIVEACMITPDQDSGSVRMVNLMRILLDEGHHVTFVADNLDGDAPYTAALTAMGVEVLWGRFAGSVRNVLRQRGASLDTIVFCRYYIATQYVNSVRALAPRARIVFDTVDLHFLREEREAALMGDAAMHRSAASTRSKEIAVIEKSDITLVVSTVEKALLAKQVPHARVEIISNITPPMIDWVDAPGGPSTANVEPFDRREGILFIGGFRHPPNVDAMKWYVVEVLPLLRNLLPGITTTVVGSHMPEGVTTLAQDGLLIRGFVANTQPMLRSARVSIAPLRYGSGVKGKISEAMNHGIPVVATSTAVEAMQLVDGQDVLVADSAAEFAAAIVRLYGDAALWAQLSTAGRINVQKHFSPQAAHAAIRSVFSRN